MTAVHSIGSKEEHLAARLELLEAEKELTRRATRSHESGERSRAEGKRG
jgi:predicted dithiol-disulfide oxidoreductase (DUF899 family)